MLNSIYAFLLNWLLGRAVAALKSWYEDRRQKQIADDNVKKFREAVERGDVEEIKKRGSDLLNGLDRV